MPVETIEVVLGFGHATATVSEPRNGSTTSLPS